MKTDPSLLNKRLSKDKLPITVLIAAKNEEINLSKCLRQLYPVDEVIVVDSESTDRTCDIAKGFGVSVVQFKYSGGYPKKRQWAMETLPIASPWIMLLDADEIIPDRLWEEIREAIHKNKHDAFFIKKGFHFLGKKFRFGGFSHKAILLFKKGKAQFEELDISVHLNLDMEVHERIIVDGSIGHIKTPLIHEDDKGLEAYLLKHNYYSTWEAHVRFKYLRDGKWGKHSIIPRFWGNTQERRRFIKSLIMRLPFEPTIWFFYHYFLKLGFLHGIRGYIASRIRANYIRDVHSKIYELKISNRKS